MPLRSEGAATSDVPQGFGPKTLPVLADLGILTQAHLDNADPFELYLRCRRCRPGTSLNMLYGIIASQERVHWSVVAKRRSQLEAELRSFGL